MGAGDEQNNDTTKETDEIEEEGEQKKDLEKDERWEKAEKKKKWNLEEVQENGDKYRVWMRRRTMQTRNIRSG